MEDGPFSGYGKKLLLIGLFLWGVAVLVGGEDDPGLFAQIGEARPPAPAPAPAPAVSRPPPMAQELQSRSPRRGGSDPELDAWYAEAGKIQESAPAPLDESHLIDDTRPIVTTEPVV